jgi:hypothetical protein
MAENNYWVEESIDIQERDSSFMGLIVREYENWDVIYDGDEYEKEHPGVNGTDREGKSALRLLGEPTTDSESRRLDFDQPLPLLSKI